MKRTLAAPLVALGLLLVPACGGQSGDSNTDSQVDEVPGDDERTSESGDDD